MTVIVGRSGRKYRIKKSNTRSDIQRRAKQKKAYFPRPNLPEYPKVTVGAKCYGRSKRGGYIVPRFFITQWMGGKVRKKWFVIDVESNRVIAEGTDGFGYESRKEAVQAAQNCQKEFGPWTVLPF